MITQTLNPEIATFAAAVKAALADLPPEELDDLTDGLEADLAERAEDGGAELGDPVAYAEELRAAAGYPPRPARSHLGGALPNFRTLPQEVTRRWSELRSKHRWVAAVSAFLVTLRPVWWVFRGVAAYALAVAVLSVPNASSSLGLLIAAGCAVVSVQWGRGKWMPWRWMRGALVLVNIVVVIAAPFLLAWTINAVNELAYTSYYEEMQPVSTSGGALTEANGNQVTNIFAYDAQGNPIPQVQLFDQDGKPLNVVGDQTLTYSDYYSDATGNGGYVLVPNGDVPGRSGWNVYPLGKVDAVQIGADGTLPSNVHVTSPTAPFATTKPLSGSEPSPASTTLPTPSASPTPAN